MKSRISALLLFFSSLIYGQTDVHLSSQIFNRASFNPAFISRPDFMFISVASRLQWAGLNGSPKTINTQISDYYQPLHSAIGLSFVSDKIGFTSYINPMLMYSYKITDEENWGLSFGIAAGVFSRNFDFSRIQSGSSFDPTLLNLKEKETSPDLNLGVEFQRKALTVGISTTHLLSKDNSIYLNTNHRYAYLNYRFNDEDIIGYSMNIGLVNRKNMTIFQGGALVKLRRQTGLSSGLKDIFDFGFTYRTSKMLALIMGIYATDNWHIVYAFDKNFNPGYSADSSHEVMIEFRIPMKSASTCVSCNRQKWF